MENNSTSANSQPSATCSRTSPFPLVATVIAAVCIVPIVFLAALLAVMCMRAISGPIDARHLTVSQGLAIQFVAELPLIPYLLFIMTRLWRRSLGDLGFRLPVCREAGIGILGAIAMFAMVQGLAAVVQGLAHTHHEQQAVQLLKSIRAPGTLIFFVLYAVIVAPFIEELTFRVFVFNAVFRFAPFWIAALLSGLLFGAAHGDLLNILPLAAGGMLLCYIYVRTANAWISMISHGLFNGFTILALLASQHAGVK